MHFFRSCLKMILNRNIKYLFYLNCTLIIVSNNTQRQHINQDRCIVPVRPKSLFTFTQKLEMKKFALINLLMLLVAVLFVTKNYAQADSNWTQKQLMKPSDLANIINEKTDSVLIFSVGPFKTIPNAINVGMASEKENLDTLKALLKDIPKDREIVIYCGCCPFEHCPNVRSAIDALKEMNFTNYYLLNIPHNIKINWIDKGYPVTKE